MDKGTVLSTQNDNIQSNTEDDELDDFVLQIDEADINNKGISDDDMKDEDGLKSNDDAEVNSSCKANFSDEKVETFSNAVSSAQISSNFETPLLKNKTLSEDSQLANVNKLDRAHKDSRFSNHDRLDTTVNPSSELLVNSSEEHLKQNCDSKSDLNSDSGSSDKGPLLHNLQTIKLESCDEGKDENNKLVEKESENRLIKVEGKNPEEVVPHKMVALIKNEEVNCEDAEVDGGDEEFNVFNITETKVKLESSIVKQDKEDLESIDKELDSLLCSEPDSDTNKKTLSFAQNSLDNEQKSNSSFSDDIKTVLSTECSSLSVSKTDISDISNSSISSGMFNDKISTSENKTIGPFSNIFKNKEKTVVVDESESTVQNTNKTIAPTNPSNNDNLVTNETDVTNVVAMDSEDSIGNYETDDSSVCSSTSRNTDWSRKTQKSNSDNKKNTGCSASKGHKRATEHEEHMLRTKKSKIDDTEQNSQPNILNGLLSCNKKTNGEGFGESNDNNVTIECKKKNEKEVKSDSAINKLNGHIENDVNQSKADEDFLTERRRVLEFFLNERGKYEFDMDELDKLLMMTVTEYMAYTCDPGRDRQRIRFLENEQIRISKQMHSLKKQVEDAKHIIKKLIDEKVTNQPWAQHAQPLKVTRSVGLQVCTVGSLNVSLTSDKVKTQTQVLRKDSFKATESARSSVSERINRKSTETDKNGITNESKQKPNNLGPQKNNFMPPSKTTSLTKITCESAPQKESTLKSSDKTQKVVEATIDLTDAEDNPQKPGDNNPNERRKISSPAINAKPPSALLPVEKMPVGSSKEASRSSLSTPAQNSSWLHSGATSRKSTTPPSTSKRPAAAELNTYDHLPKYPLSPKYPPNVNRPPRPVLRIGKNTSGKQGIMLSWNFEGNSRPDNIEAYQLYAFQESKASDKSKVETWKKVGDIKALPLPMACFLTQFMEGHKYHFIVRAVDKEKVLGDFSFPGSIILQSATYAAAVTTPK